MTTLRAAAQQALEALETLSDCYDGDDDYDGECASCHTRSYLPHDADCKRNNAITTLRAALAQEQAEPVAWIHTDSDKPRVRFLEWREDEPGYRGRWIKTPLYTAPPPPQRKPLTEEEIMNVFHAARNAKLGAAQDNSRHRLSVVEIARAIEQAHGIIESEIKEDKA